MTLASSPGSFAFNLLIIRQVRWEKREGEEEREFQRRIVDGKNNLRLICGSEGE